jgi:DNA polymerase (family 10)
MLRYLHHLRSLDHDSLLIGTELDILPDGRPVFPEDLLGEVDIRVGAVHAMATVRMGLPADKVMAEWRFQNRALIGLGVEILAHPFRYLMTSKIPVADEDVDWIVDQAAAHNVALEVNSHYLFPELDRLMVRECLAKGVRIAIGTDAHRWSEVTDFSYHDRILTECGVTTQAQRNALLFRHDL